MLCNGSWRHPCFEIMPEVSSFFKVILSDAQVQGQLRVVNISQDQNNTSTWALEKYGTFILLFCLNKSGWNGFWQMGLVTLMSWFACLLLWRPRVHLPDAFLEVRVRESFERSSCWNVLIAILMWEKHLVTDHDPHFILLGGIQRCTWMSWSKCSYISWNVKLTHRTSV